MIRYPDNPSRVSLAFLKDLDAQAPGTWLAQPKLDGWRKIADNTSGQWVYSAKHDTGPAAKPLPDELRREFEALPWPPNIVLDMEWCGNRCVQHVKEHSLHVFDLLSCDLRILDLLSYGDDGWLGQVPFEKRYSALEYIVQMLPVLGGKPKHVHLIPCRKNPGLVDYFAEQLTNPLSEGLVVRHKDSKLVGSFTKPAVGDRMFKVKHR